ncbi:hypothetical protein N7510_004427 [Penicillium lagena]|uniref:uncharacterized protein n=1 Tax=Penicillium lagena TaxID=94218 RepID=UPI002541B27F|nr:uncharacterized protein N7510_004427 [Penicillium lagena]KAJ5620443.1 hypothetical protein N7510_004427 [Penicillium lagena]
MDQGNPENEEIVEHIETSTATNPMCDFKNDKYSIHWAPINRPSFGQDGSSSPRIRTGGLHMLASFPARPGSPVHTAPAIVGESKVHVYACPAVWPHERAPVAASL